ncbi:DUF2804 domain-containing protein [Anaerocolumna sp. MB42-C2]|uniref:DUF2804 domain-containing protein n=1 Tax=Anaerocolumna sp. MB42-C2 TaxID=3070997 RepID=UPI0027E0E3D1|nr:DUF2804 domain-containing protein [Anaerocolumna sp. MB42-C2]WMJ90497.1 DUF2804 domain-containing protein [Anaerocolumna sp. MB42-C2]
MQKKITEPTDLLNKHGELIQTGYATTPLLKYNRKDVTRKGRLKEWDYYMINNESYAFALTVGYSAGYLLISISIIDFINRTEQSKSVIKHVHNWYLPESSQIGDILYKDVRTDLKIIHKGRDRGIFLYLDDFLPDSALTASISLSKEPKDSMVIATPFKENKKYFYYNQKIVGMSALGSVSIKGSVYNFDTSNSFGLLDWGRGVWPYKTTWYWSSAFDFLVNNTFGFNLGYGFGDTSNATENMLFFNGIANKLDQVDFGISKKFKNKYDYTKPWNFTSSDNRITMTFEPIYDRNLTLYAVLFSTRQHQVFGKFSGTAVLDDGRTVYLNNLLGFAERVVNRW